MDNKSDDELVPEIAHRLRMLRRTDSLRAPDALPPNREFAGLARDDRLGPPPHVGTYTAFFKALFASEASHAYRVRADYPMQLERGHRRHAINFVHGMCHAMRSEPCTPSATTLLFDRFVSLHHSGQMGLFQLLIVAAACLTAALKLFDTDDCMLITSDGESVYMHALLYVLWAPQRRIPRADFFEQLHITERFVLMALAGHIHNYPCALALVANATGWPAWDVTAWQRACFLCDMFSISVKSANFTPAQIAAHVVNLVSGRAPHPGAASLHTDLTEAIAIYACGDNDSLLYGVVARHHHNPQVPVAIQQCNIPSN